MMSFNKNGTIVQTMWQGIFKNKIIFVVFLLLLQNIAIFWQHYFNNVGFPWDFVSGYYAWPAFWTTAVSVGIFPEWMPYQSMGYPLAINAQSGLHYPIFWIFAMLHIPYTLNAAVILQVLHVLFGSIGMFLLLNSIFKSSRYAIIGAVAFQFFGGFYSNAEHADIIRAFAMAPWLFYVFKVNTEDPKITKQLLFIPIVIYFLASGGYPGNFISALFIMSIFLSLEVTDSYLKHVPYRRFLKIGAVMAGLLILGISMSAVHLGPIWQGRNELTRFHDSHGVYTVDKLPIDAIDFQKFPYLFMSNTTENGEISMTSIFLTLPMLIFASFISISAVRKYWVFIGVMILSFLMVAGPQSPFWQIITSAIPALKLSRFPASDYKIFIAIPIIIFGIAGLRRIIELRLSWKEFLARTAFVIAWFSAGSFLFYSNLNFGIQQVLSAAIGEIVAVFILAATILFIVYYLRKNKALSSTNKSVILSRSAIVVIALLISADGFQVISDMQITWNERPFNAFYIKFNVALEKNGKLITHTIFQNIPNERPVRTYLISDPVKDPFHTLFSWMGNLNGSYMMQDEGYTILVARSIVESNDAYRQYMLMKWTPIFLEPNLTKVSDTTRINMPVSTFSNLIEHLIQNKSHTNVNDQIVQIRYGINDIAYQVRLKQPKIMVENEIYFPGWQADLIFSDKQMKLQALVVNGAFRAWLLPAGDYKMIAHFSFPNLLVYQSISIVSFAIWVFIIMKYWRRQVAGYNKPIKKKQIASPH